MKDRKPTTVYAVQYDYYEDSRTVAIFADRAIAEAHAAELGAEFEVEAYDLVDHPPVKAGIFTESGIVQPDGTVSHRRSSSREDWDYAYMSGAVLASTSTSGGVDRVHLQAQSPSQAAGDAALAAAVVEVNRWRVEGPWPVERGILALPGPAVACPVVLLPLSFWLFVVAGGMWPGGGGVAMGYLSLALFAPGIGVPMWYFAFAPKSTPPARAAVAVSPAREPVTLAAPDSGPGQCRVCGMEDLGDWADGYVVAYGTGRAHRDCEAVRPYVSPAAERDQRTVEHRAGQHDRAAVWNCRVCADPKLGDRRDRRLPVVMQAFRAGDTATYIPPARLKKPVMGGATAVIVDRDPGRGHFRLGDPVDAGRFEIVEVIDVDMSAFTTGYSSSQYVVAVAEPLRHDYRSNFGVILDPMPQENLFNHDAGRPFTHVELGMVCVCDRCVGVVESGPPLVRHTLRASVLSRVTTNAGGGLRCEFPDVPSLPPWTPDPRLTRRIAE